MNAYTGKVDRPDFVPLSAELNRVSKVPRRVMSPEDAAWLADELTARLKKPRGTMRLKPVQGWALYELGTVGGLLGALSVGSGKTLVSLLAPVVMKSHRPVLIVPAGLVEKTKRDKEVLEQHWHLPLFIRIMSYEWLGREQAAKALTEWDPDLVILDECHRAKNNRDAAVARRITRFFREHSKKARVVVPHAGLAFGGGKPVVKAPLHCAALSGTVTKRSLHDYAHILTWCLPAELLPIPTHYTDLSLWADALDEKKNEVRRIDPGALEILCVDDADRELWRTDRITAARKTYRRRLVETPGVVATSESKVDASLVVRGLRVDMGPGVDEAFTVMRKDWKTPDGWTIPDAITWARHARELALGFFYVWDPRPPIEWQRARAAWHQNVREILKHSRTYDSEKQVRNFALQGALKVLPESWHPYAKEIASPKVKIWTPAQRLACSEQLMTELRSKKLKDDDEWIVSLFEWKGLQNTFEINTRPEWIDATACEFVATWARKNTGIVWTEHTCVGSRLSTEFGLNYYGRKGLDAQGRFIYEHDTRTSLAASRPANGEGLNLQGWCKNLITSLLPNGARNEQLLGRTHREGQFADEVEVEFIVSCDEHLKSLDQALKDARYIESSTGSPQKLLLAAIDVDEKALRGNGPRWNEE